MMFTKGYRNMPPMIPKPEPVEINIDLERILPPVEYSAGAGAIETVMVWTRWYSSSIHIRWRYIFTSNSKGLKWREPNLTDCGPPYGL